MNLQECLMREIEKNSQYSEEYQYLGERFYACSLVSKQAT